MRGLGSFPTKVLNQAVQRNIDRFPPDFMFQVTEDELDALRSQIATSKNAEASLKSQTVIAKNAKSHPRSQSATLKDKRGGRRTLPYVFTEQGVALLSSVLRSPRAVEVNIAIIFEYQLLKLQNKAKSDLGQFRTPRQLRQFMVQLVDPDIGDTIYDPACGTAGFLVEALDHILAKYANKVWFYEIKNDGYDPDKVSGGGRVETPNENGIPALLEAWAAYKASGFQKPPGPEANTLLEAGADEPACWWASIERIAESAYSLSAATYKPSLPTRTNAEDPLALVDQLLEIEKSIVSGLESLRRAIHS